MPRAIAAIKALLVKRREEAEQLPPPHGHGRHGYDPNQPRVPAGNPRGGQWTRVANGLQWASDHIAAAVLAVSHKPPRRRLPGWLGVIMEAGLIAIEVYRNLPWDLFG